MRRTILAVTLAALTFGGTVVTTQAQSCDSGVPQWFCDTLRENSSQRQYERQEERRQAERERRDLEERLDRIEQQRRREQQQRETCRLLPSMVGC